MKPRTVAYLCATAIVVCALLKGYDGTLATLAVVGLLGIDKAAEKLQKKKG